MSEKLTELGLEQWLPELELELLELELELLELEEESEEELGLGRDYLRERCLAMSRTRERKKIEGFLENQDTLCPITASVLPFLLCSTLSS